MKWFEDDFFDRVRYNDGHIEKAINERTIMELTLKINKNLLSIENANAILMEEEFEGRTDGLTYSLTKVYIAATLEEIHEMTAELRKRIFMV